MLSSYLCYKSLVSYLLHCMSCILLRCKWPFGPFAFNKLINWLATDWLTDWLTDWSIDWSIDQLIDWLIGVMFRAGVIPVTLALETTRYLGAEMSYNPWASALKHLSQLDRFLSSNVSHEPFKVQSVNITAVLYTVRIKCLHFIGWVSRA